MTEQNTCRIAGFEYIDHTVVCRSGHCAMCNDGIWEEKGELCPCWTSESPQNQLSPEEQ